MRLTTIDHFLDECGITPGMFVYEKDGESGEGFVILKGKPNIAMACYVSECDGHLYVASRELLKTLIAITIHIEDRNRIQGGYGTFGPFYSENIKIIELALPGKTWENIKERLEEINSETK